MSKPASTPAEQADHESHGSTALYLSVFVALCFLTACSFWTYSEYWPKSLNQESTKRIFMMCVSVTKAMLVMMFFMHLKWEANWKWVLTIPSTIMAVFLMLMLVPDVGLRMRHASQNRLLYAAEEPATQETTAPQHDSEKQEHESNSSKEE